MSSPPISREVQSIITLAEELLADPASLSDERAARLRRYLILIANGSRKALRLAGQFERGEIDADTLLEMKG